MRDLIEVFTKIVDEVPADHKLKPHFNCQLDWLKRIVPYKAPEIMGEMWAQVAYWFEQIATEFRNEDVEWTNKTLTIWNDSGMDNNAELWICGQVKSGEFPNFVWDFQGVFDTEEKAVDACRDESYFIFPIMPNALLPRESIEAPRAYYPKAAVDDRG